MNSSQEEPEEKKAARVRRPWMVTLFAFIIALSSITEGLTAVSPILRSDLGKPTQTIFMFLLCPLVMGIFFTIAWGLWKLKNWSRYALIVIIAISFFSELSGSFDIYKQNPLAWIAVVMLSLLVRGAIIVWFLKNGKYFDGSAFAGMPQEEIMKEDKDVSIQNNQWFRMIVVSSLVGVCLIAMILVYIGYLFMTRETADSVPTRAIVTATVQRPAATATPQAVFTAITQAPAATAAVKQYASAPPMTIDLKKQYFADFKMARGGDFVVQLYPDKAPITVNNFVFLARDGFFNGVTFHRVLEGFMAQGGDPTGTGMGGPGYEFVNEDSDLKFDKPGVLAMANAGRDTNGSQFFITFVPATQLNGGYTIFGQVISGMDVVNGITLRDPDLNPTFPGDAIQTITITEK